MREYGKIGPAMWTRGSGKRLRGDALGQAIASYLCTSPHANMIGLYYIAIPTIAHETGHTVEDVRAALKRIEAAHFAYYDEEHELVFVPNGAGFQIGDVLKPLDKRIDGIVKELRALGAHRFVDLFLQMYGEAYCLDSKGLRWGLQGASEPSKGAPARAGASAPAPAPAPAPGLEGVQGEDESVSRVRVRPDLEGDGEPFRMPDAYPLTADARSSAETLGLPASDIEDEWINFRARQIRDGRAFTARAWLAAWTQWCVRAKQFQSERRIRDSTRGGPQRTKLQPAPENAPWMREGYGDALAAAGKGGT